MTSGSVPPSIAPSPWSIDLNCDMGESDDSAQVAVDLALMGIATSVNIACGGHAGTPPSMERTVQASLARGVAIGAHPSFIDRANFGRTDHDLPPAEVEQLMLDQIQALCDVARRAGARLTHVKPHGALYHAAMTRMPIADAIARASRRVDPALILVGLAGAAGLDRWRDAGCPVAAEAFADRRYEPDGSLRARSKPDALITDSQLAARQAVSIARGHGVTAIDGSLVAIRADTICIHSDTPGAVVLAGFIRKELEREGVKIRRFAP